MGAEQSKELKEYSAEEVAECLERHGPKFSPYSNEVRENRIAGSFLFSLSAQELGETLEDIGVSSRLHARMLTKDWEAAKEFRPPNMTAKPLKVSTTRSSTEDPATTRAASPVLQSALVEAKKYQIDDETPPEELESFAKLASTAMEKLDALYAGVHLIDQNGHLSLSSRYVLPDGSQNDERFHARDGNSLCHLYMLDENSEYVKEKLEGGKIPFLPPGQSAEYAGHIVRGAQGERVAMICTVTKAELDEETKQTVLSELAAEAEHQLHLRKILVQRKQSLKDQINQATLYNRDAEENGEEVVAPAFGPLAPVTRAQVASRRATLVNSPDELAKHETHHSSILPSVVAGRASKAEMRHLPEDYFDELDSMNGENTPVPKDDEERVAFVESLGLTKMDPDGPTAQALQRLTRIAAEMFGVSHTEVTVQTHSTLYGIARHVEFKSSDVRDWFYSRFYPQVLNHSKNGEPLLCAKGRGTAMCNYPLTTKKTFVVNDLWADKSFEYLQPMDSFRFYSGTPLFLNGYAIGVLCIVDWEPHPEFGLAQELQAEQIAKLIEQQLENYVLRNEINRLEVDRRQLASSQVKTEPPEHKAALIFTDVQGSTRLWETNSNAMNEALQIHDKIMRKSCSEHNGYEIVTEGDAFHLGFHDAIDAVSFALKVQEELHNADWSDEILSCPDACEDKQGGFRGLRVRMSIHYGEVVRRENEVSKRLEYCGDTYHIAKSLEHMSHGGQILVSDDVWSIVSYVSESSLGSPQVLDLGTHVLLRGKLRNEGLVAKGVFQLVPSSLAFDYFHNRKRSEPETSPKEKSDEGDCSKLSGRQFPPVLTQKQTNRSFHDAPYDASSHNIAMCFVYTTEIENRHENPSVILAALSKLIGSVLLQMGTPGYQCKNFMLAFPFASDAALYALKLQEELALRPVGDADLKGLLKIGIHEGFFTAMGPNPQSGRADYFGKVVNRAARVAGAAIPGGVFLGRPARKDGSYDPSVELPHLGDGLEAGFVECKSLKGVSEEMALYACSRVVA